MKKVLLILTALSAVFGLGGAIYILNKSNETALAVGLVPVVITLVVSNIYLYIKYQDKM